MSDDFFAGAGTASARGNSDKFNEGIYPQVRIDELKVKDGYHGMRFIVETTVIAEPSERTPGVTPTAVGAKGSWNPRIDGKHATIGLGEVKAFIGVLHGLTPAEVDAMGDDIKPLMYAAIKPEQPFKGYVLSTECWKHTTGNGFPINKHVWELVSKGDGQTEPAAADAAPAAQPPTPPAPAPAAGPETPETAPGGPWYPIANDPRGTHYNASHEFRSF